MHELYEVKEKLIDEIGEYADKGKLSKDDAMSIKYLASGADHLCNIIEVMEEEEYSGEGMSNRSYRSSGRSYARGGRSSGESYEGRSYARGRGRNARRDSMGRYSSDGYGGGYSGEEMDEQTKQDIKRLVNKLESM